MAELRGGSEHVDLGGGYALVAPGLRGRAERIDVGPGGVRARDTATTPVLEEALAKADMSNVANIEVQATPVPGGGPSELRDVRNEDALLLEVPDLGPTVGQVVLASDEAGALIWHYPLEGGQLQPPAVRGSGQKKRFYIRRRVPPAPPPGAARDRALLGAIGRKLLKVIVYPITDALLGAPATAVAEYWERANRAYGLRDFSPDNYRQSTAIAADQERLSLKPADLDRMAAGRALLFIHGTFSTAHGAFHDLPPDFMSALSARYGGRVLAFNHFTMAHDPERNVRWFVDAIAPMSAPALEVDVICHSRGGLVARLLAERNDAFGIGLDRVRVNRLAFVGVPNQGTLLTDPDHMSDMIDRFTNALNLVPPGGVADILEGILIGVKIIGHGALGGLTGLQSMNPRGAFLGKLNKGGRRDAQYFAIAADYEPTDPSMRSLVSLSANSLVDRVFENTQNDLVVPENGVYDKNGNDGFPIATGRCLRIPGSAGVMHTTMFGYPDVVQKLNAWLQ
jgi:hypothetical protein